MAVFSDEEVKYATQGPSVAVNRHPVIWIELPGGGNLK